MGDLPYLPHQKTVILLNTRSFIIPEISCDGCEDQSQAAAVYYLSYLGMRFTKWHSMEIKINQLQRVTVFYNILFYWLLLSLIIIIAKNCQTNPRAMPKLFIMVCGLYKM